MDEAQVESIMTGPTQVSWGKWRGEHERSVKFCYKR
jgi:hypothetical protein